jgi:hypothetical protein
VKRGLDADAVELRAQVHRIEGPVVRHDDPPAQQSGQIAGHLLEARRPPHVRRADPVDGLRAQVPVRVEQGRPLIGDRPVRIDVDHRDLGDAVPESGEQPGRLGVDDRVPPRAGHSGRRVALAVWTAASHNGGSPSGPPCTSRT